MTSDRAQRIEELFAAALDWPPSERETNLKALCQDDGSLFSEVMALVEQDSLPDFLKPPAASFVAELLIASDSLGDVPSPLGDFYDEDLSSIDRRFNIIEKLGIGSFGSVYRAMDTRLKREVAVKVLNSGREGLLAEARAQAKLKHPAVVDVYEVLERAEASFRDGRKSEVYCIVMEYIDGLPLDRLIRVGELTPKRSAEILAVVAEAVAHAHRQNLLHRDLKPQNILLSRDGHPKVADFGIAVPLDNTRFLPHAGTPAYMSPEQTRAGTSTVFSDVWSLGVVLYEMLTRRLPFDSSEPNLINRIQASEPPRPIDINKDIPPELERICLKCLNKDPNQRFPSAAALASELRRWLSEVSVDNVRPAASSTNHPQLMCTTGPTSNPTVVMRSPAERSDSIVSRENVSVPLQSEDDIVQQTLGAGSDGNGARHFSRRMIWGTLAGLCCCLAILANLVNGVTATRKPMNEPIFVESVSIDRITESSSAGRVIKTVYQSRPPEYVATTSEILAMSLHVRAKRNGDDAYQSLSEERTESLASATDLYRLYAEVQGHGHLYVFQIDSSGKVNWLFPKNKDGYSSGRNPVTTGVIAIPNNSVGPLFLDSTRGKERLIAVLSRMRWVRLEKELESAVTSRDSDPPVSIPANLSSRGVGGSVVSTKQIDNTKEEWTPNGDRFLEKARSDFIVITREFNHE